MCNVTCTECGVLMTYTPQTDEECASYICPICGRGFDIPWDGDLK
jgi:DNA-directed RNA polymerase subunit RPC12/RpoP